MKIVRLDKRLLTVAGFVREDVFLVDVGTDHAYLIGNLAKRGRIKGGIACDINEKPLESAKKYISFLGVEDRVATVLSDGFLNVGSEFDDGVVAGMGGDLILKIMSPEFLKDEKKRFILQPMTKEYVLRSGMWERGFELLEEVAVKSGGKCYSVMVWQFSGEQKQCSLKERYLGRVLDFPNEDTAEYLNRLSSYLTKKVSGIKDEDEKAEYTKLLTEIAGCL